VAARSKACVCGLKLAGTAGSNPAGGMDSVPCVCCCQVKVSGTGRKCPTECSMSECDIETSTVSRPEPTEAVNHKKVALVHVFLGVSSSFSR